MACFRIASTKDCVFGFSLNKVFRDNNQVKEMALKKSRIKNIHN